MAEKTPGDDSAVIGTVSTQRVNDPQRCTCIKANLVNCNKVIMKRVAGTLTVHGRTMLRCTGNASHFHMHSHDAYGGCSKWRVMTEPAAQMAGSPSGTITKLIAKVTINSNRTF